MWATRGHGGALQELLACGQPLERVLPAFTANPARLLMLPRKGRLATGSDADLVVLDDEGGVQDVMARGRWHVRGGQAAGARDVRVAGQRAAGSGAAGQRGSEILLEGVRVDEEEKTRGYIIPVGGAEEKIGDVAILRRFAALCGGGSCRIAIIPTASSLSDTGSPVRRAVSQPRRRGGAGRCRFRAGPTASTGSGSTCSSRWTASSSPAATSCGSAP